jgi:hypothetical protein
MTAMLGGSASFPFRYRMVENVSRCNDRRNSLYYRDACYKARAGISSDSGRLDYSAPGATTIAKHPA